MSSLFNKIATTLSILFCPLAFAERMEGTTDLITAIVSLGLIFVYFIFAICVLVIFFKKWNHTNKILEDINKNIENITSK